MGKRGAGRHPQLGSGGGDGRARVPRVDPGSRSPRFLPALVGRTDGPVRDNQGSETAAPDLQGFGGAVAAIRKRTRAAQSGTRPCGGMTFAGLNAWCR